MSSTSGSRKRSRWGGQQQQHDPTDQDAMQALLSSAQAREQERSSSLSKEQQQQDNKRHRYAGKSSSSSSSQRHKKTDDASYDYYGPKRGEQADTKLPPAAGADADELSSPTEPEQKPNFGLSGALARSNNMYKGVMLKFQEPPEARTPNTQWRLYVFKPQKGKDKKEDNDDAQLLETLHISKQSAYLLGRNAEIADIHLAHESCSSQHAVLQYRALPNNKNNNNSNHRLLVCQPYLMDLESTNGTTLNGVRLDPARYYQLKKGDVLQFGASTREYVLLTANTTSL